MRHISHRIGLTIAIGFAAVCVTFGQAPTQAQTDEYVRYDLSPPATSTFHVSYEVSATTASATQYLDATAPGRTVTEAPATDLVTGEPLKVAQTTASLAIALARPVPKNGQGRIRIDKTVKDARGYALANGDGV